MIKLRYIKATNTIVAKVKGKYYLLPNLKEIPKPETYLPCADFTKEIQYSDWNPIPNPDVIFRPLVKDINIGIQAKEDRYRLFAHLPKYVLNGIQNIIYKDF